MTPKQAERIQARIKKIKAALAADKKHWGGYYHDGQGLRYMPPRYYIQLNDHDGGMRYLNWFQKKFPDDSGFPDFLFEWTIILFKKEKLKEAEKKAFKTFCRNTYLFDKFFGRHITAIDKWEGSNLETAEFAEKYFTYSHTNEDLADFAKWLSKITASEKFKVAASKYIEIYKRLKHEHDYEMRGYLGKQARQLEKNF